MSEAEGRCPAAPSSFLRSTGRTVFALAPGLIVIIPRRHWTSARIPALGTLEEMERQPLDQGPIGIPLGDD